MPDNEPMTDQGRWLLDHQGLVNISKPAQPSMRGDEIDLRASILTIEREAREARPHGKHEQAEPHSYRLECSVCGWLGQIRVSVDPQNAEDRP